MFAPKNTLMALTCIFAFIGMASADATADRKVYFYLNRDKQWCGLENIKLFQKKVASKNASEFDVDQGTIAISGNVVLIEEYQANENAEASLITRYSVKPNGVISSARVSLRTDEGERDTTYKVINGTYVPQGPKSVVNANFRKVTSLSAFPFFKLILEVQKATGVREICTP